MIGQIAVTETAEPYDFIVIQQILTLEKKTDMFVYISGLVYLWQLSWSYEDDSFSKVMGYKHDTWVHTLDIHDDLAMAVYVYVSS